MRRERNHETVTDPLVRESDSRFASRATLDFTMVFVLDNYDSFTYNLVQYLGELGAEVEVRRNDELTVEEVEALKPERILLSPGPCTPARGRHSGPADPPHGRQSADSGRLPGPSGHRRGLRRPGGPRQPPDARQNQPHRARRQGHLCWTVDAAHLHPLPLADRRRGVAARRVDGDRAHRQRRRKIGRSSWACAIARCPSRACSSTRRAC